MRQLQALTIMMEGRSVFLTGAPGAGKTYVLNQFIQRAKRVGKNVAVTASTGIAATHIGGSTIHSWSGLGIREHLTDWDLQKIQNDRMIKRYNGTDVLVIDEVSMLHGHRLDMVNQVAKLLRKNTAPFGGMQVILVGDLFQLPPISRGQEPADFVHQSRAWQELDPKICYLTEQHRQATDDGLLSLLQAMRRGDVNEFHEMDLRERMGRTPEDGLVVTRLYSHNIDVDAINNKHLGDLSTQIRVYKMKNSGQAAKIEQLQKSVLAPMNLELKTGAEVMFVANNFGAGYANGTRGRVVDFVDDLPLVQLASGREVKVELYSWKLEEDGRVRAEVAQLPLRLAWAITIHKSQGMSLDAAEIDLSRSFTPGMGYVALSRVRSLEGVYLQGINQMALAMHPIVFEFDVSLQEASEALANITPDIEPEAAAVVAEGMTGFPDVELLRKLKAWRLERAKQDQVSAFIIAHNTMLDELAIRKPQTAQALLGVKGFGQSKLDKYGEDLLAILTTHAEE